MNKNKMYDGRLELLPMLWCKVDGEARVWRTEFRDGIQRILLLDLDICWEYIQHLRVKNKKALASNEKVKVEWKVYLYCKNMKVGLCDVLLSSI